MIRDLFVIGGVIFSLISIQDIAKQTNFAAQQAELSTQQLTLSKNINSAQFVDTINQRINSDKFKNIIEAIEGNDTVHPNSYKIWDQDGGQFTNSEISDYIDNLDEIGNLYTSSLVDKTMMYNEFSYDVEKAWCNDSIQNKVKNDRQGDGSGKFNDFRTDWWGFEQLAIVSLQIDQKTCSDLNHE